jgi:hypothetical protein
LSFEYWSASSRIAGFGDVNRGVFLSGSVASWTTTPPASDMSTSVIALDVVVDRVSRQGKRWMRSREIQDGLRTHTQGQLSESELKNTLVPFRISVAVPIISWRGLFTIAFCRCACRDYGWYEPMSGYWQEKPFMMISGTATFPIDHLSIP